MKKWLLPIRLMVIFLALLGLFASFSWTGGHVIDLGIQLRNFLLVLGGEFLVFFLFKNVFEVGPLRWEHFFITSSILFLLFDSLSPWWVFLLAGAIAQTIERLLRVPGGPLFNPAASGAFVLAVFELYPSWWGTNFSPRIGLFPEGVSVAAFFTFALAGYIAYRYKKLPIALAALLVFFVADWLIIGNNPLYIALEGTFAFFLLVMAVEPKTSPNVKRDQYIYGALLGLLVPLGIKLHFPDPYLGALLLANLYTKRLPLFRFFQKKETLPSSPSLKNDPVPSPSLPQKDAIIEG